MLVRKRIKNYFRWPVDYIRKVDEMVAPQCTLVGPLMLNASGTLLRDGLSSVDG